MATEFTNKCYECKFRRDLPGDCHSQCINRTAKVAGHETGVRRGWFGWPYNYDPVWLIECSGFESKV